MKLLHHNKKAVSEIIGYVLLISIAVGLSVVVLVYLKDLIPKDKPTCEDNVNLFLQDHNCKILLGKGNLTIRIVNKGLFMIDAVYVYASEENRSAKNWLNDPNDPTLKDKFFIYLEPEASKTLSFESTVYSNLGKNYSLEIAPGLYDAKTKLTLNCNQATIFQRFACN